MIKLSPHHYNNKNKKKKEKQKKTEEQIEKETQRNRKRDRESKTAGWATFIFSPVKTQEKVFKMCETQWFATIVFYEDDAQLITLWAMKCARRQLMTTCPIRSRSNNSYNFPDIESHFFHLFFYHAHTFHFSIIARANSFFFHSLHSYINYLISPHAFNKFKHFCFICISR